MVKSEKRQKMVGINGTLQKCTQIAQNSLMQFTMTKYDKNAKNAKNCQNGHNCKKSKLIPEKWQKNSEKLPKNGSNY